MENNLEMTELHELVRLGRASGMREVTLAHGDAQLTVKFAEHEAPGATHTTARPRAGEVTLTSIDVAVPDGENGLADGLAEVRSPMVGVFRQGVKAVGSGSPVVQDKEIGVIDSMSILNSIAAPCDGEIVDVYVEEAMPVEYNQLLYTVRRAEEGS
ncbi:MAG: hypothetical protein KGJ62_07310 [Armatimonadetes bacterium]|nr:hypothetical protein [Armatimonadota bacterium]MDE2206947.1 hypothetical protein [Armatimonadota bacterium]